MPTLLGMYDALLDNNKNLSQDVKIIAPVKKSTQLNNFTNLSPTVQKMLANISDQNENIQCSEDHSCKNNIKNSSVQKVSRYLEGQKTYSSNRLNRLSRYEQKTLSSHLNKSTECLSAICDNVTTNVQKMLSNIPDQDLVINCIDNKTNFNCESKIGFNCTDSKTCDSDKNKSFLYKSYSKCSSREMEEARIGETIRRATSFNIQQVTSSDINSECNSYRTSVVSPRVAKFKSRTIPGNYLQVTT